ncbi:unnamed protein product [Closterium sp. Naga37s-1]|nr:unnamed protein product [Closterium sp. Naga37s-1]
MAPAAPSNLTAVADCASVVAEAAVQLLPAVAEMGVAGVVYMAAASCAQHVGMLCRISCASPVSSSLLGALCIAAGSLASAQASQVVHAAFHPPQQTSTHQLTPPLKTQPRQGSSSGSSSSSQQRTRGAAHGLWGLCGSNSGSSSNGNSIGNSGSSSSRGDRNSSSGTDRPTGLRELREGMERAQKGLAGMRRRAADELAHHDWLSLSSIGQWPSMSPRQAAAHVVVGLLAFKMLGGRFCNLMPSDVQKRGAFVSFSLPAKGSKYATGNSRGLIKDLFHRYGCHHCGTRRGECIADHIPTNRDVHGARWLKRSKQTNSPPTSSTSAPTTTATTAATATITTTASTATTAATPALEASKNPTSWPARIMPLGLLRMFRPSTSVEGAGAAAGGGANTAAHAKQARAKPAAKSGRMPRVSSASTSSSSRLSRSPTMKHRAPSVQRSPSLRRQGSTRRPGTDTGNPGVGEGKVEDGAGGRVKRGTEGAKQGAEEGSSGAAAKEGVFGWLGLGPGQAGHGVRESQRQRLYPQCAECSGKQSAAVRNQRRTLVLHRRSGWPLPCLFGGFFIHPQLMAQGQETIDTMTGKG